MKKFLIGSGIACLVLALAAVVALDTDTDAGKVQQQQQRPQSAVTRPATPPTPPPTASAPPARPRPPVPPLKKEEVVKIEEDQLIKYLAVRKAALPAWRDLEAKRESLPPAEQQALVTQVRAQFEEGLKSQGLSVRDFRVINRNVSALFPDGKFDSAVVGFVGNDAKRAKIELQLIELDEKMVSARTSPEEKKALAALREQLEAEQMALAHNTKPEDVKIDPNDPAVLNGPLLDRYQELVQGVDDPHFDQLVAGQSP